MAVTLSNPPYSFVEIYNPRTIVDDCMEDIPLCLPVKGQLDLSFQIIASVTGSDKDWFNQNSTSGEDTFKSTVWARICSECGNIDPEEPNINTSFSWSGVWRKIETGGTDIWIGNFTGTLNPARFNALTVGECFKICFYRVQYNIEDVTTLTGVTTTLIGCTETCFVKITDECYTSRFTYGCNEDTNGFIYTDESGDINFTNAVRLPCYLRNMQLPSSEKSYVKSSGAKTKLYERTDEEYDLVIDYMPNQWHKNMKVLLGSDNTQIQNVNSSGNTYWPFVNNEKYDIGLPDEDYPNKPATTKIVRSEALSLINSNCK